MKTTIQALRMTFVLACFLGLAGCEHLKEHSAVPEKEVVKFDKSLLKKCDKVDALPTGKDTDNLEFTKKLLSKLTECSLRQDKLSIEVKKAFNIKD